MRDITAFLICAAPALVLAYDLIAYRLGGSEATITHTIQRMSLAFPELPAIAAALFVWLWCHLFLNHIVARVNHHLPPLP